MSSNFDKFRALQISNEQALDKVAVKFVTNGLPSITITNLEDDTDVVAAVVYDNDQFEDTAYVYVLDSTPLTIGSFVKMPSTASEYFLILDQELIAKHVMFYKYFVVRCNMQIDETTWGFFKRDSSADIQTKKDRIVVSSQTPTLVAPSGAVDIDDVVTINGRPGLVVESDTMSSSYIGYYTLHATTAAKDTSEDPDLPVVPVDPTIIIVSPLQTITLATQNGYFSSTISLNNVVISASSVTFSVPIDAQEFEINIKSSSLVVTKKYKVVL